MSKKIVPTTFAQVWACQNMQWVEDDPESVILYEDLKNDFRTTLGTSLSRLGIAHTPDDILSAEQAVYSVEKLRPKQPEIYRTGTTDEWKQKLDPAVAQTILDIAGPTMERIREKLGERGDLISGRGAPVLSAVSE